MCRKKKKRITNPKDKVAESFSPSDEQLLAESPQAFKLSSSPDSQWSSSTLASRVLTLADRAIFLVFKTVASTTSSIDGSSKHRPSTSSYSPAPLLDATRLSSDWTPESSALGSSFFLLFVSLPSELFLDAVELFLPPSTSPFSCLLFFFFADPAQKKKEINIVVFSVGHKKSEREFSLAFTIQNINSQNCKQNVSKMQFSKENN
jgi:hypothetical protein